MVRRTLRHLTAAQKLLCAVVVIITALIWWSLLNRLLAFGRAIDYSGLHALGAQTVALLQQYNPFFWWGVVALCTLLIVYLVYGFVAGTQRRVRRKLLTRDTVERLATQLSDSGRAVLDWAWQDRRDPISVGVLQLTLAEMRSGRAQKISLARQHDALLNRPAQPKRVAEPVAFTAEM